MVSAHWLDAMRIGSATRFSYRVRHRSGEYRWIQTQMVPVRNKNGVIREWIGSSEDIHVWREAQEALRVNEERLRLALEGARMVTWEYDYETGHVAYSDNSTAILGLQSGPISEFWARVHQDDRSRVKDALHAAEAGKPLSVECRFVGLDGDVRWLHARANVLRSVRRNSVRIIGVTFDITAQKAAEERHQEAEIAHAQTTANLQELETKYRALKRIAGDIVWSASPEGKVRDMPLWREFTGQTLAQVQDWGWLNAIHPADREKMRDCLQRVIDERGGQVVECRVRDRAGAYRWFRTYIVPVPGDDGTVREWLGTCHEMRATFEAGECPAPRSATPSQGLGQAPLLPWQIRAARAILGWSARQLAEASGISLSSVRRIEEAQSHDSRMLAAVRSTLEQAGVEFLSSPDGQGGVRPAPANRVQKMKH
jgi:PAS domain S-box-containing protein